MAMNRHIGIVGSEAAKFTKFGEIQAKLIIKELLADPSVTSVVSGGCHLGGVDIWAAEEGNRNGLVVVEFLPEQLSWKFYKERNLKIVSRSDEVHCITVDTLPTEFKGMTHHLCYHCKTVAHVKSGGCWTMKQAILHGKHGILHVVRNHE